MTIEQLAALLEATGLPVAYQAFRTRQDPPFLCYRFIYDVQFFADDEVYFSTGHYQVELYTSQKSPDTERAVEAALGDLGWDKTEAYLDEERIYQIIYEIEV